MLIDYRYQSVAVHCRVWSNLVHQISICQGLGLCEYPSSEQRSSSILSSYLRHSQRHRAEIKSLHLHFVLEVCSRSPGTCFHSLLTLQSYSLPVSTQSLNIVFLKYHWKCESFGLLLNSFEAACLRSRTERITAICMKYKADKMQLNMKIKYIWICFVF